MAKKQQKTCLDAALGYLTSRMRSAHEMQRYLDRRGYPQDEIDRSMGRLRALGYVDDAEFAGEYVRSRTATRPVGRRRLAQALRQKGIKQETIEDSLTGYSPQAEEEACRELFRKLAKKHGLDRAGLAKIQRALVYRGFGYDMIRQAAEVERE